MHSLTLGEIARITGGQLHGDADIVISSVSTDSRNLSKGSLFGAIVGQRSDGHDFVEQAMMSGAVAVLGTRIVDAPCVVLSTQSQSDGSHIDRVITALGALATHERSLLTKVNVIGITGSSGKTTTKDIIGQVLATYSSTCAPAGSPNNELGLPQTILDAPPDTANLVLEMGMRGFGHIKYLCQIAQPNIAVVTNVGTAHIGEVGSIEGIALAKSEIVESLPETGLAILNADDHRVRAMATKTQARSILYGTADDADIRATDIVVDDDGLLSFTAHADSQTVHVNLPLIGMHNVLNALAAIAVGLHVGMSLSQCADALGQIELKSKWRMERHDLKRGIVLINDAYNANPESMKAAITSLASFATANSRWLVVAGMHELGADSDTMHRDVGQVARTAGVNRVVVIGETAKSVVDGAGDIAVWVPDRNAACDYIEKNISDHDVILIKASRSEGLEVLAQELENRLGRATG